MSSKATKKKKKQYKFIQRGKEREWERKEKKGGKRGKIT
jgi:hypothetical protein